MTSEAALLGVPTFSCYPDKPFLIEMYLIKKGLISRKSNLKELETKVLQTLRNVERAKKMQSARAEALTSTFEDPIDVIFEAIKRIS